MENDFQFLNVLNVSSRKQGSVPSITNNWPPIFIQDIENHSNAENNNIQLEDDFGEFAMDEGDYLITNESPATKIMEHVDSYLAAVLEKCIIEGRWYAPIKCKDCLRVFAEDEIVDDDFVKLKMKTSKLRLPARSTVEICKATDMSMRELNYEAGKFHQIQASILAKLNISDIFWASDFSVHSEAGHKIHLIKVIIEMYIKNKQDYISRCNTLAAHDALWRSMLKKIVHFKSQ